MIPFHDAQTIITEIEQRRNRGHGLPHFLSYMDRIGNPHRKLACIHVAGTNGKGSTTNDLRSVLQEAGYRCGSFTSPYMETHLDRIRINDMYMDEKEFIEMTNLYYESWLEWDLSMFEIDMMLACVYFVRHQVDFAVFEVGLGGRLDATNILHPIATLITNIGLDHMDLLGDTHVQIAEEKAGIIKACADVYTAETRADCLRVFQQHTQQCGVNLHQLCPIQKLSGKGKTKFSYRGYSVTLATQADYQMRNAALAMEVLLDLRENQQLTFTDEQLLQGLQKAIWIGRFEILREDPLVILDGAHNPDGIQALCDSLNEYGDIAVLFSVLKDKNFAKMLDLLETRTSDITITQFANARVLDPERLKQRTNVTVIEDYKEAVKVVMKKHKTVVITGSLYFVSEIRKYWKRLEASGKKEKQ